MREKASLLRAVRKRVNSVCVWEQAAARTVLSAPAGASPLATAALGEFVTGCEPDSCAELLAAKSRQQQAGETIHLPM
jgi:hypothetical protein